jgi:hypothetical protein
MHGDETSGRMLLPMMAEWLCNNKNDPSASRIINGMHLVCHTGVPHVCGQLALHECAGKGQATLVCCCALHSEIEWSHSLDTVLETIICG